MNKGIIIGIIILIIFFSGIIFLYKNYEKQKFAETTENLKYVNLNLNFVVTYLEDYRNSMNLTDVEKQSLNDNLKYCVGEESEYIPSIAEINKLKIIQNIWGSQVCYILGTGGGSENCSFPESNLDSCNKKFNISYKRLGTRPHSYEISVFKCSNANYLLTKHVIIAGPPRITIDKIKPDDNQIIQSL